MNNKQISPKQLAMILSLSIFSGGMTIGAGRAAGRDMWLLLLLSGAAGIVLFTIYGGLCGRDHPFEMLDAALPAPMRAPAAIILGICSLFVCMSVLSVFAGFTQAVGLPGRDIILISPLMGAGVFFFAKCKIETIGRAAEILLPLVFILLILPLLSLSRQYDFRTLLPVMSSPPKEFFDVFLNTVTILFGQGFFAIIVLAPYVKGKKPLALTASATALFLSASAACNVALLGFPAICSYFYPAYTAAGVIRTGGLLQRMEVFIAAAFLICELFKAGLTLSFAKSAFEYAFPKTKGRFTLPFSLTAILTSMLAFNSILSFTIFLERTRIFIMLPVLVIPPVLLILKQLRKKNPG